VKNLAGAGEVFENEATARSRLVRSTSASASACLLHLHTARSWHTASEAKALNLRQLSEELRKCTEHRCDRFPSRMTLT
jgi:hypothetical protein